MTFTTFDNKKTTVDNTNYSLKPTFKGSPVQSTISSRIKSKVLVRTGNTSRVKERPEFIPINPKEAKRNIERNIIYLE